MVENVDEKTDTDVDSEEEESYRRPVVRTFIGKTVFVLGEMYHAVKSPSLDDVEIVEKNDGGNRNSDKRRQRQPRTKAILQMKQSRRCDTKSKPHSQIIQLATKSKSYY